jgi:ADP-heptose:LPS heptosyltransferase
MRAIVEARKVSKSEVKTNEASSRKEAEAGARACLVRFGSKRLALSRVLEALVFLFLKFTGPEKLDGAEPRNILVIEYWYLGDLVMLTPFLKNLRLHFPKARITLLASPRVAPLLEGQDLVDEVISVCVPWAQHLSRWKKYFSLHWLQFFKCVREVRRRHFDWGFAGRADIRENLILSVAGVRRRIGYGFGYGASLLTDVATPDLARPHYSDRWLHLIEYIGKPVLQHQPELKVLREEKQKARQILGRAGICEDDILIGMHAGARNPVRQWGEQNFLETAQRLVKCYSVKILWFHEPGSTVPTNRPGVVPIAVPLPVFLAVVSECRLFVCNDTGPMHLAAAVGVPVVAVFGPGMSAWWGPRSAGSQVVAHEGVWCRPCFDYCRFDQPYCLRTINVESVFAAASNVLVSKTAITAAEKVSGGQPSLRPIETAMRE